MNGESTKKKFSADNLWIYAMEAMDSMDPPGELRKRDLTKMFIYELEQRISKRELVNINITGPVRTGKSTAAMAIAMLIKKFIEKYHKVKRPMGNKNIVRDQNEYSRLVKRRPESFKHECDVIDEWAEMELSGYNATVEEKYLKDFSDRQAARYYHRIACSPGNQTDVNAELLLQTVPGSREHGRTLLLLSYRATSGEQSLPVLIGHVEIDVQPALNAKWYKEYLRKKEQKWELMNKHNVKSPRELEYAEIILNTYDRMAIMAKYGLNKRKHFKIPLQEEADKKGVWFSILGDRDVLETLEGLGEIQQLVYEAETRINKMKEGDAREQLEKYKNEIRSNQARIIERLHKLIDLWDEYQRIDEE